MKLQHAASHQGVGRQGVGAVTLPVDDEHAQTTPGEQHPGGGAGASGADHHNVVIPDWAAMGISSSRRPRVDSDSKENR